VRIMSMTVVVCMGNYLPEWLHMQYALPS